MAAIVSQPQCVNFLKKTELLKIIIDVSQQKPLNLASPIAGSTAAIISEAMLVLTNVDYIWILFVIQSPGDTIQNGGDLMKSDSM